MPNPYPTINPKELLPYGVVRRTHGHQGEVSITLSAPTFDGVEPEFLFLLMDDIPVPYRVANIRGGGDQFIVGFEGMNNLSDAEPLVGWMVQIHQSELPEEHSEHPTMLSGYVVHHPEAGEIGAIVDVDTTTSNILILVERPDESEVTLPLVEQWMEAMDHEHRTIIMNFPLDLLDL